MAVPDYQTLMLPLLELASDRQEHAIREAVDELARSFGLSDAERSELLPSGRQTRFANRVNWAGSYMRQAGLLASTRRGHFQITDRGLEALSTKPVRIDVKFLERYPEFVEFRRGRRETDGSATSATDTGQATPEETMEAAFQQYQEQLSADVLQQAMNTSPPFFEQLVVDLLVRMGYGGTREEAGKAIGASGDAGIDGIINEDRLGLDVIYVQAKRWKHTVGRPEIQTFVGALTGKRARRGVFITTSSFSHEARSYARSIDMNVILIDGVELSKLMIEHGVGVRAIATYDLKEVDAEYFD